MALKWEDYKDGTWAVQGKSGAIYHIARKGKSKYGVRCSGKRKWRGLTAYSSLAKAKAAVAAAERGVR